jgi:hypothetical protein
VVIRWDVQVSGALNRNSMNIAIPELQLFSLP